MDEVIRQIPSLVVAYGPTILELNLWRGRIFGLHIAIPDIPRQHRW